ncbi:hypothetical protein BD410DRAFT_779837 [Rickenella mellea]|uniref:C2H2-type domain-containing protein n=1 Tax=Rickenella mellea TaxID=50990 RepID=A0A4R5XGV1_9AGAM|nr:hypothetical protein BD410DRAFT_779837 [Rickenella mellea]
MDRYTFPPYPMRRASHSSHDHRTSENHFHTYTSPRLLLGATPTFSPAIFAPLKGSLRASPTSHGLIPRKPFPSTTSDFQSNNAHAPGQLAGLGIQMRSSLAEISNQAYKTNQSSDNSSSHAEGGTITWDLDRLLPKSSPLLLSLDDPFNDAQGSSVRILGGMTQTHILSGNAFHNSGVALTEYSQSGMLVSSTHRRNSNTAMASGDEAIVDSVDAHRSSTSRHLLSSPPESHTVTNFLVDINMYAENGTIGQFCIRPQDLMRRISTTPTIPGVEPESSSHFDSPELPTRLLPKDEAYPTESPKVDLDDCNIPAKKWSQILDSFFHNPPAKDFGRASRPRGNEVNRKMAPERSAVRKRDFNSISDRSPTSSVMCKQEDSNDSMFPLDVFIYKAHEGVAELDVLQKTAFFRKANPGQKLPDEFLWLFAGKMSPDGTKGRLHRCYITGCNKITKRKDHMADHVRTHLGEKPFRCGTCGLGFIRNNDCQRHQFNHKPDKRFTCECKAAFTRKDLFVRHKKVSCPFKGMHAVELGRAERIGKKARKGDVKPLDDDDDWKPSSSV